MPAQLERTLWINLDRCEQRRTDFLARVQAVEDWPFPKPKRVAGVEDDPPPWWKTGKGAWGCFRAHMGIYHTCLCLGIRRVAIFEDDAVFCDDFGRHAKAFLERVPDDWDALYFGGNHYYLPERVADGVLKATCCSATHSYAITSLGMLKLMRFIQSRPRVLADENAHIDTMLATLQEIGILKAYCPDWWMVGQAAGPSLRSTYSFTEPQWFQLPARVLAELPRVQGVDVDINERGAWLGDCGDAHCYDPDLANALVEFCANRTVLDLGCGKGDYVRTLRNAGVVAEGVDGNPETPVLSQGLCNVADLTDVLDLGKHDVVLCLEVAEHVPPKYEPAVLENIVWHCRETVVLSWAHPGQVGAGHVNTRPSDYVEARLSDYGLQINRGATRALRAKARLPWFRTNLFVAEKVKC